MSSICTLGFLLLVLVSIVSNLSSVTDTILGALGLIAGADLLGDMGFSTGFLADLEQGVDYIMKTCISEVFVVSWSELEA